jgi:putative hydrolase of HD superfamily
MLIALGGMWAFKVVIKMFGGHMLNCRKAMMIRRYQNAYMSCQPSVAEHMWAVAKIAQGLALWEINKFGNNVDMGKLLQKAINHDLIEIETGDILSTTKDLIPELRPILVKAEECAFDNRMMLDLPMSWREDFRGYILNPKDDSIEGKIIAADVIDTKIYQTLKEFM